MEHNTDPLATLEAVVHPSPNGTNAAALTVEQVQGKLREALDNHASESQLAALVSTLADASGRTHTEVRELLRAEQRRAERAQGIAAEAASLRADVDRREIGRALTHDYLLPTAIAEALRVRCRALPTDDVAAAVAFLVGVSGLVKLGTRVVANRATDFRVPLNLYAALVARSGAKKSPVSRLLVDSPSKDLRLELAQSHDRAMRQWEEHARGLKAPERRPTPPRAAYLKVCDATAEALASQLEEQEARGLGLLLHRDELAGLFASLNQYKGGKGSDEELLLEAYDGSGFHSLRVATAGGGRFYDRCHVSIWGTIQPKVLEGLVAGGDDSGLWARFLFVPLPERVVRLPDQSEAEERAASRSRTATQDEMASLCASPAPGIASSQFSFARPYGGLSEEGRGHAPVAATDGK